MDELLQLVLQFMQQLEGNIDDLDDAESAEITKFLQEVMGFVQEQSQRPPEAPIPTPMPEGVDLLWILSGGQTNPFLHYLNTYPGEGFKELLNNPQRLIGVIEQLEKTNPLETPQVGADGMEATEFPSSNVSGMKYDENTGKLLVKFHGDKGEPVYQYDGVPPKIFYMLQHGNAFAQTKGKNKWGEWWPMKNPSIGAALNQYIKKLGFPYKKIR